MYAEVAELTLSSLLHLAFNDLLNIVGSCLQTKPNAHLINHHMNEIS